MEITLRVDGQTLQVDFSFSLIPYHSPLNEILRDHKFAKSIVIWIFFLKMCSASQTIAPGTPVRLVGLVKGFDPATAQGVIEACDHMVVTVQRRDLQQYQSQFVEIIGRALGKGKIEEEVYIPFGDNFGEFNSIAVET
jgi:hypothetical protein